MASKRRGGFRPPELRGTLGTLIRTTTGVVRDALERGAREGRARLDGARASRRRHDALADLGELVLDLIRRGEIDLAELPEARDLVRELDDLDDDSASSGGRSDDEPDPPRISARRRFDDRGPPPPPAPARRDSEDDGTVSSGAAPRTPRPAADDDRARPSDSPSTRAATRPMKGLWRPMIDDAPSMPDRRTRVERWDAAQTAPIGRAERASPGERGEPRRADGRDGERQRADGRERPRGERERERTERPEREPAERPERARTERPDRPVERPADPPAPAAAARFPSPLPGDPTRKGGITFDDEDLADYMHPDDVPPRPPAKDPDDHDA